MKKSDVLEMMRDLPEEMDIDQFIYSLWLWRKVERALADEGEDIPHEEVVRESMSWRD